jgi:hypothetical protein
MRSAFLALAFVGVVAVAAPAQDPARIVGVWKATTKIEGFDLYLTIARDKEEWKVSFEYKTDGKVAGTSIGIDTKFEDGGLYYFHKHVQKAIPSWREILPKKRQLRLKEDRLEVHEIGKGGKNKVIYTYKRVSPSAEVAVGPDPIAGVWKGTYPGAQTTILLKIAGSSKDGYAVEGFGLAPTGKVVGHFPALDAEIAAGATKKLTVDVSWDAFPGATLAGTSRLTLVRDATGINLSIGANHSALRSADASEFGKLSPPTKTKAAP